MSIRYRVRIKGRDETRLAIGGSGRDPVLDAQSLDAPEFPFVVADQGQAAASGEARRVQDTRNVDGFPCTGELARVSARCRLSARLQAVPAASLQGVGEMECGAALNCGGVSRDESGGPEVIRCVGRCPRPARP